MEALLQCGHVTELEELPTQLFQACPHCKARVRLRAVECRRWVGNCGTRWCRKRWFELEADAREYARTHKLDTPHRFVTADFVVYPPWKDVMRIRFGRKVGLWMPEDMLAVPYPEKRALRCVRPCCATDVDEEVPF